MAGRQLSLAASLSGIKISQCINRQYKALERSCSRPPECREIPTVPYVLCTYIQEPHGSSCSVEIDAVSCVHYVVEYIA